MLDDFDIGPLTWVKDEIDQALKSVLDNYAAVAANLEDLAPLRFSQTHLYQVSGALDMVGLEGCKRFCGEIEKLTGKLEKKAIPASAEVIDHLTQSIHALSAYLQDLLNGMPDMPMRLYPQLSAIAALQGEQVDESELFFPDTSFRAPKDLPSKELPENEVASYIGEQRSAFQKALLNWIKSGADNGLQDMRSALENVQQIQTQAVNKTLWWAATAFIDALAQDVLAQNNGAKRLCRRIDQQLKSMSEGGARASGNLLRDILYYLSISADSSELVTRVKQIFELDKFKQPVTEEIATISEVSAEELATIEQLLQAIDKLKDVWTGFAEGNQGSLEIFLNQLGSLIESSQALSNRHVAALFASLHELATALELDSSKINESALIETAAGLNLLEDVLRDYLRIDAETTQKLDTQVSRIQDVLGGGPMADLSGAAAGQLDSSVLLAVAEQVKDALKVIEQSLDSYFRNPADKAVLDAADKPLEQVIAAFDMLEMPVPAGIASISAKMVSGFKTVQSADTKRFELVAESLSMLGFFVDELPRARPESYEALDGALSRLEQEMSVITEAPAESGAEEIIELLDGSVVESPLSMEIPPVAVVEEVVASKKKPKITVSIQSAPASVIDVPAVTAPPVIDRAADAELLEIYLAETEEVLATVAQNLQALRVNATDKDALTEVRRGFHTLKGSGRTVGLQALGEVAGSIEKLLNLIIDKKLSPTPSQIVFIEKASAAFAGWAAKLQEAGEVELDNAEWLKQAAALENEVANQAVAPVSEDVLIGGTHKISRALFNIFMGEAEQHMKTLQDAVSVLSVDAEHKPSHESRRAAHTLASNAGTAGFKAMGELARALEYWLDVHSGNWTADAIKMYQNVVVALAKMLAKAAQLEQPKQSAALLRALNKAIKAASAEAEAAVESEAEVVEIDLALPEELMASSDESESIEESSTGHIDFDLPELAEAQQSAEVEEISVAIEEAEIESLQEPEIAPEVAASQPPADNKQAAVDQELLTMFIEEAKELVPQVGSALRAWRAEPQETDHPDSLQRALHTLKGSARMAGQSSLGDTVHALEDRVIKVLKTKVTTTDFDDMFAELDQIGAYLEDLVGTGAGGRTSAVATPGRSSNRRAQYLRLRADVLDRLINEAGEISIARSRMDREMQGFKQFSLDLTESVFRLRNYLRELEIEAESQLQSRMSHLQETNETFDPLEFDRFTRLQELTRMMAESVNDVSTIQHGLLMNLDETESALQQQNRMNRELQHGLMNVRMVPFSLVSERLQRIVRQTSRELSKPVQMVIDGEDVEIDRSVLEKIGAPLEHLLRNAVAHGMENPAQRKKAGKSAEGSITLKVRHESDEIILTVTDDGGGINLTRVREKAIEKGLFSPDQDLSEHELLSVIFEPGFSTAADVTQIAGRGVGLDSVRSDISALGGRIDVNNAVGQGAVFSIYLPVTLSVAQVVIVRAGSRTFALPSVMVEQVQKLKPTALAAAYESQGLEWSGRHYPVHFLSRLIGDTAHTPEPQAYTPVLLLRSGTYQIALHVDEIVGNQEVVMKPIGPQLARVPGMIGATVMGDGSIVLILNAVQLANREFLAVGSVKISHTPAAVTAVEEKTASVVMVVDDSLTMRKVLSRLLEREGHKVLVAKDGMDALQLLQEIQPDIILSDIEMPRMDGFEFSRNVRADAKTADIPIVIISSRTADKHRKLAEEIGVNAYLGKPVQDEELIAQVSQLLGRSLATSAN